MRQVRKKFISSTHGKCTSIGGMDGPCVRGRGGDRTSEKTAGGEKQQYGGREKGDLGLCMVWQLSPE